MQRGPGPESNPAPRVEREGEERPRLQDLAALPDDAPELDQPLPDWVTEAHRRWLETGEGDPWGGYFS
jgi:hypothetical protein